MHKLSRCFSLIALLVGVLHLHAEGERVLFPSTSLTPKQVHGEKAFKLKTDPESMTITFADLKDSDDYTHIDLGAVDLKDFRDGGHLEIEAEVDNPVLRICATSTNPQKFWDDRQIIEGGALMVTGKQSYRYYLDVLTEERANAQTDHLYLFLQDLGGSARGKATVKITKVSLHLPEKGWEEQKKKTYATQYQWPQHENIEPLYYEDFARAVDWASVASDPFLQTLEVTGTWKKKSFGEKTWDYAFLADRQYAQADYATASDWKEVTVPESPVTDQVGGHDWYRKEFVLPSDFPAGRLYMRFDDLADDAQIYVNGQLVGTQASTEKRLDWVVENGARALLGKPVKQTISYQHFDRCNIPFPFDIAAIPEGKNRLILPIYSGQYEWPYAYDVTGLLKPGKNVIAVRIYGNPMRGWWIFRHRDEDRAAKNIFGILGQVTIAGVANPAILNLVHLPATSIDNTAQASHRIVCTLKDPSAVQTVRFRCGEKQNTVTPKSGESAVQAEFTLPANFESYRVTATVFGKNGRILDQQEERFFGTVIEIKNRQIWLNGEPFLARGFNCNPGVEFDNDRHLTKKEFLRLLRHYQQMGANAIRTEGIEPWQMQEAFRHGMMVMPVTAAGSCNWCIGSLGQLRNPDFRLACDRQESLAVLLYQHANILLWNGGNEMHHTPGYLDKPIVNAYLIKIQEAFKSRDPYKRPVTYANLDTLSQGWFFYDGQDVVGWNIYNKMDVFEKQWKVISAKAGERPVIFTEWGTFNGKKDREGKFDEWESDIGKKWAFITSTPGSAGGFFFPFHGEMEDDRGRRFMQSLLLPFELKVSESGLSLTNRDVASMREVNVQLVNTINATRVDQFDEIKPGHTVKMPWSATSKGTLEIRYETHRGLKHFYTQEF